MKKLLIVLSLFINHEVEAQYSKWITDYIGSGKGDDIPNSIKVDTSGNVYVSGVTWGDINGGYKNWVVIKYNSAGSQQWVKTFNGSGGKNDESAAMVLDKNGNVYVTGYTTSSNGQFIATIKYSSDGTQKWISTSNNSGASAIALDDSSNVYVTGPGNTIKYNTYGTQKWVNGSGGEDIVLDKDFNIYVTNGFTTTKYKRDGSQLWQKSYTSGKGGVCKIVADFSGNIYVTGTVQGGGNEYLNFGTIKYDKNGKQLWVKEYNGTGSKDDEPSGIVVDSNENVYVTGYTYGTRGSKNFGTIKYDKNGSQVWIYEYEESSSKGDYALDISIDFKGNVYVAGKTGNDSKYTTLKYNPNGKLEWVNHYNSTNRGDFANKLTVDYYGNVYVTGNVFSDTADQNISTIKYCVPPDKPLSIKGPTKVCQGQKGVQYSITPVSNATSYSWKIPSGATIVAGGNTNSITVNFNTSAISDYIKVSSINNCTTIWSDSTLFINVKPLPDKPTLITGDDNPCEAGSYTYFISNVKNATSYYWTLPQGFLPISPDSLTYLDLKFDSTAINSYLSVQGKNSCGLGNIETFYILVRKLPSYPGPIIGDTSICQGETGKSYYVTINNSTTYNWELPYGASYTTSTNNTSFIGVKYNSSSKSGFVSVQGVNICGKGKMRYLTITVDSLPEISSIITRSPNGRSCPNQNGVTYSIDVIKPADKFDWNFPSGVEVVSGQNTNRVLVNFTNSVKSGNVSVLASNNCGTTPKISTYLNIQSLPYLPYITKFNSYLSSNYTTEIQWFFNGILIPGATSQYYTPKQNGSYYLEYLYVGCIFRSNTVIVTTANVELIEETNPIIIYPNPTSGKVILIGNFNINDKLVIYNSIGQEVFETNNFKEELELGQIGKGVFTMKIISNGQVVFKKIILN